MSREMPFSLVLIGVFARLIYGMAMTPLLALFAKTLCAKEAIVDNSSFS
jgi:hypothetical protein